MFSGKGRQSIDKRLEEVANSRVGYFMRGVDQILFVLNVSFAADEVQAEVAQHRAEVLLNDSRRDQSGRGAGDRGGFVRP